LFLTHNVIGVKRFLNDASFIRAARRLRFDAIEYDGPRAASVGEETMTTHARTRRIAALGLVLVLAAPTWAADPGDKTGAATPALVRGYLERMGGTCRVVGANELRSEARAAGTTYPVLVKVDPARFLVYLALDDFFPLKAADPARGRVVDRMATLNYEMAVGKLEWDAEGGQVRLSHSFSTEDGLGYRTFSGVLATLLSSAGPVRKALAEAADRRTP
jgi:hypothetical protein